MLVSHFVYKNTQLFILNLINEDVGKNSTDPINYESICSLIYYKCKFCDFVRVDLHIVTEVIMSGVCFRKINRTSFEIVSKARFAIY